MSLVKKKLLEKMPQLRRYSYGLTGSIDKGDELLQDSIVKILSKVQYKIFNFITKQN
jgi:DNA-directed RNA polymerase specialized sigma24 family protein